MDQEWGVKFVPFSPSLVRLAAVVKVVLSISRLILSQGGTVVPGFSNSPRR